MQPVPPELRAKRRAREPDPILVPLDTACRLMGEVSRSKIYEEALDGQIELVKMGDRTLAVFASLKRRAAALPRYQPRAEKTQAA